jgi:hypothetical protein
MSGPVSDATLRKISDMIDNRPDSATVVQSVGKNNFGDKPGTRLDLNIQSGKCTGCAVDDRWNCPSSFVYNLIEEIMSNIR